VWCQYRGRCIWSLAVCIFCGNPRRAYAEPVRFTAPYAEPIEPVRFTAPRAEPVEPVHFTAPYAEPMRFIAPHAEPILRFARFIHFTRFIHFAIKKHLNKYFLNL
jgi:hypothetical protein